ncbi:ribonuclease R [Lachnoclostridium sp. An196]|uniref:ribonuclease R n=1 Tax=Lachnoclostridium sp. An196 TaxID=1965583 RepID=UPI000B368375|nr:ribonuclease R [Lachnoclostridium sp. An196]OUP18413.1 ribonuclease R [Lachnoclostridium sp. An196]
MTQEELKQKKEMVYGLICSDFYVPMKIKEMAIFLQVPKERRQELQEVLDALLQEGKIEVSQKGKYQKSRGVFLTGVFTAHPKGFGFVSVDGMEEDVFIPEDQVHGAMHQDTVQITVKPGQSGKRREGAVNRIVKRGTDRIVGLYQESRNFGFVIPDNERYTRDIFVPKEDSGGAVNGHKVVVELVSYGTDRKSPEGKVVEILGHISDPGTDILSIVKGYDLPVEFPEKVMRQAERVPERISEADMQGRTDLRDVQMVTIDGEDAKDLDDAVSLEMNGGQYILGVHIADVANYVQEGSALDREAFERGTSVYLVDRVIPMLPRRLSNGICSLNEGQDRLALSCIMTIDQKGKVLDHVIAETVIRVDRRMTYTSVKKILEEQDAEESARYEELVPMFQRMQELAGLLRARRRARGSIDFDFPETKVILDEKGEPVEILPYDRNTATKIIEDFMLIANETVAEDYFWQELPFVYRTHENPDPDRMKKLSTFINNFGYSIRFREDEVHPKELQKLLERLEGTPEETLISRLTLRSMKQAKYTTECTGHFGLAARYYCHFTSPIRRYPDLQIHRIIKDSLRGRMNQEKIEHYRKILDEVAKQSSERERRADEAERETIRLKKAEYMSRHLWEEYDGVISGVTGWGLYVELPNTVEGLVHVASLQGDYFEYNENAYEMVGQRTGKTYRLGQTVRVQVVKADRTTRTVDFELAEQQEE